MLQRPDPRADRVLLADHVAGDAGAFGELVRRHRDRLWAVALRTLRHEEDAADALQDALVAAFRSAGTFRGDATVSTWLHRIVVNACLDRIRRDRARPQEALGSLDRPTPRDPIDDHALRLDLTAALATLPPPQRLAVVLVDVAGMPVAEAAAVLGTRVGTVKSRCARGRARLAEVLAPPSPAVADRTGARAGNRTAVGRVGGGRASGPPSTGDTGGDTTGAAAGEAQG